MAKDAREQRELKDYYEFELTYLRKLGAEFAQRYPKIASRLQLETSKTEDPHVERLLDRFQMQARIVVDRALRRAADSGRSFTTSARNGKVLRLTKGMRN